MPAHPSLLTRAPRPTWLLSVVALSLVAVACGGDDGGGSAEQAVESAVTTAEQVVDSATTIVGNLPQTEEEALQTAEELAEDLTESLEGQQAAVGGGSATLTVGDQTWTFDSVLCAFGEEQIGAEGAEFVLSSIQDGLQLYVSIDGFGQSVSLNDITDFENPSVALHADGFSSSAAGGSEEFVVLDGTHVEAIAGFRDDTSDSRDTTEGTLQADCP